jgi:hypothetical protein
MAINISVTLAMNPGEYFLLKSMEVEGAREGAETIKEGRVGE